MIQNKIKYFNKYSSKQMNIWKKEFLKTWILILNNFIQWEELEDIKNKSISLFPDSYKSSTWYNLFVDKVWDNNSTKTILSKIKFYTKKSCICYDQIPNDNKLKILYNSDSFKKFICDILGIKNIYPYKDNLSGININYYNPWDSLQWHFDNCEFTITLLIKKPDKGGIYQYFPNKRYNNEGNEDYENIEKMINWKLYPEQVDLLEGDLILFKWTESLHRVTEVTKGQRILVTFCYNKKSWISLSKISRKTFFWRIS